MRFFILFIKSVFMVLGIQAKEYHVSKEGDDKNKGTASKPFKTITKASEVAQAGDIITVHAGVYRESIAPPRGGTSNRNRIIYQAAEGGEVIIKGWVHVAANDWKATVTGYDWMFYGNKTHVRGGALSALWHQKVGPVFIASIIEYTHKLEAVNMQWNKDPNMIELTPRLELKQGDNMYLSITDFDAKITSKTSKGEIKVTAETSLKDADQNFPEGGALPCTISYLFDKDKTVITVKKTRDERLKEAKLFLPVISANDEKYQAEDRSITVNKKGSKLLIETNQKIVIGNSKKTNRVFNFVPGMEAIPLSITWENFKEEIEVTVQII